MHISFSIGLQLWLSSITAI